MQVFEVKDRGSIREFFRFAVRLYRSTPQWIQPIENEIESLFNPAKNKLLKDGACKRWLLKNDNHETMGRIAAFVNNATASKDNEQPTGGIGFFECVNDHKAANLLFDTAKNWLAINGMQAMDGPINFGDRNAWWGLLVEGFDIEPNYQCNYHFPYYQNLFENYGFQVYFKQYTFGRNLMEPLSDTNAKKAEAIIQNPDYSFRHLDKTKLAQHALYFMKIYNAAWTGHTGVTAMNETQALSLIRQMKPIMDERVIWFGFYKGEPIAFFVNLPEVNQIFKYVRGRLNVWGKITFAYHQWRKTNKKLMGLVFGIDPAHHGKGVDAAIVQAFRKMVQEDYPRYVTFEMNWIGDFNPKMINVARRVGGDIIKTHHTYRYLFDRHREFKRMPVKA
ncbi:MAG: hypothetical protein OEY56_05545 [Cyclobacteriaceae bacterium]|nr:hypothetical protein [Cyclobacteriaceae bacterium]